MELKSGTQEGFRFYTKFTLVVSALGRGAEFLH